KVVTISSPGKRAAKAAKAAKAVRAHGRRHAEVNGVATVSRHLPFSLSVPRSLVGLPRNGVHLLDWGGKPAALVTYGQNLGGIAVIERTPEPRQSSSSSSSQSGSGGDHQGLSLPSVSINGATGRELDTALGTGVQWSTGGVQYT